MALIRLSVEDFSNITSLATGLYIQVIKQHGSERIKNNPKKNSQ